MKLQENPKALQELKQKTRHVLASYMVNQTEGLLENQYLKFTPGLTDVPIEPPFGFQNKVLYVDVHHPGIKNEHLIKII